MRNEDIKRPGRPVPVPEDYDDDDFAEDYYDSNQDEDAPGVPHDEQQG